jgi:hypothetical protein
MQTLQRDRKTEAPAVREAVHDPLSALPVPLRRSSRERLQTLGRRYGRTDAERGQRFASSLQRASEARDFRVASGGWFGRVVSAHLAA